MGGHLGEGRRRPTVPIGDSLDFDKEKRGMKRLKNPERNSSLE